MAFIAAAGVLTSSYYCPHYKLLDIEAIAKTFCKQMFQFNEESVLRVEIDQRGSFATHCWRTTSIWKSSQLDCYPQRKIVHDDVKWKEHKDDMAVMC